MEMEFRYGSGGTEPMKIHRRRRDTKSTFIGQTCNYIVYSPIDFTSTIVPLGRDVHRNSQLETFLPNRLWNGKKAEDGRNVPHFKESQANFAFAKIFVH